MSRRATTRSSVSVERRVAQCAKWMMCGLVYIRCVGSCGVGVAGSVAEADGDGQGKPYESREVYNPGVYDTHAIPFVALITTAKREEKGSSGMEK